MHYIKPLHWSLWMARGVHVFHSCEICKQTYYRSKICSPSDGGHWIYRPLLLDVRHPVSALISYNWGGGSKLYPLMGGRGRGVKKCTFRGRVPHRPEDPRNTLWKKLVRESTNFFYFSKKSGTFVLNAEYYEIKKCYDFHLKIIISCSR